MAITISWGIINVHSVGSYTASALACLEPPIISPLHTLISKSSPPLACSPGVGNVVNGPRFGCDSQARTPELV
jgi:hypothetical protein